MFICLRWYGNFPSNWCNLVVHTVYELESLKIHIAVAVVWRRLEQLPVSFLSDGRIRPPLRAARVLSGYEFLGNVIDVVETY